MPFAFLILLYSTFILTILLHVLFFLYVWPLWGFLFQFYNAPFDASVLSCHIIAERDAGMMQIGEIERLIRLTNRRQTKVSPTDNLLFTLSITSKRSSPQYSTTITLPGCQFTFTCSPRLSVSATSLLFTKNRLEEIAFFPATNDSQSGIAHHTGEKIEIICAWFAGRSHVSPHAFQGTYRDALFGVALYLAG